MAQRIPNPHSPEEVRRAFGKVQFDTAILTKGASGQLLVGAGVGVQPAWSTSITSLTLLTVDNITINGASITSDTGSISFGDENIVTTGSVSGVNVTSGVDPGHTHTASSITETDPVFAASAAHGITDDDIDNWDESYSWGDHSLAGYLHTTPTAGTNWQDLGQLGGETYLYAARYLEGGITLVGTYPNGKIFRSENYGLTWSDLGQQYGETYVLSIAYLESGIALAGTGDHGHILRSTDYGETWTDLGQQGSETRIRSLCYVGGGVVLAGTYPNGKIYRSENYGLTWSDLGQQYGQDGIFSFANCGGGVVVAGTGEVQGHILRSTNYGATWADLGQKGSASTISCLEYLETDIVLAGTYSNAKVLRSINAGIDWADLGTQAGEIQLASLTYAGNGVVVGGTADGGKIIYSDDYGETWSNLGQQYSQIAIRAIEYMADGKIIACGSSGGKIIRSTLTDSMEVDPGDWDYATAHAAAEDAVTGIIKGSGAGTYSAVTDNSANWNDAYDLSDLAHEAEAAENITTGFPVYGVSGLAQVGVARADDAAKSRVAGLSSTTTTTGNTDTFMAAGRFELADWTAVTGSAALTPNSIYYLGATGGLTTTAPIAAGQYVVEIGRALETTVLDLCIKRPILL
jgi:microcystin-dependent protein